MSGNLAETVVSVGNSDGRVFSGTSGDGNLTSSGYAGNADWPGYVAGDVSGADGTGFRGGSYNDTAGNCTVSSRTSATIESGRNSRAGGRCGRAAP